MATKNYDTVMFPDYEKKGNKNYEVEAASRIWSGPYTVGGKYDEKKFTVYMKDESILASDLI